MIRFTVPLKVNAQYGLNDNKGKYWAKPSKLATEVHEIVYYSMLHQKVPRKLFTEPVVIQINYNSNLDCDNHGLLTKWIIDSLKGYLLKDDKKKYVKEVRQKFWGGDGILVEIWEAI